MKIMILGAPGAGKGTIARMISKKYGIPSISTGDLLRNEIKKETELGRRAKAFIDKGELVLDELVIELLKERIKKPDAEKGFILDGFPRTIKQAEALEQITRMDYIFNLLVSDATVLQRLGGRWTCKKCGAIYHEVNIPPKVEGICDKDEGELYQREDQKPAIIKERLRVYEEQTAPLLDFYEDKIINVDANGKPEDYIGNFYKFLD
ncbi:adenylate kinase [Candidatus Woesearchaeota archaeon]|nr:adenylate kinase [Candidatus Woesearchaeota archaeon]